MPVKGRAICTLLTLGGLLLGGCASTWDHARRAPAAAISPRSSWKARGSVSDAEGAIDGNPTTAAVTGRQYQQAYITIDLGKPCVFNMVAVQHGADQFGFARRLGLWTSLDGQTFTKIHEVPGTRRITYILPIKPILARYVKLQVVTAGVRPWSVAEIYLQ